MKASEYKKLASAKQVTEEVRLPSGAVFKMRLAPIQQWVATGIMPASLSAKMQQIVNDAKSEDDVTKRVLATFTEQDFIDQQKVGRRLLEYCAVEPKVRVDPAAEPDLDAIAPEDILDNDFRELMKWIWSGGRQGETLTKFRRKKR
jgi:hypothetical protein